MKRGQVRDLSLCILRNTSTIIVYGNREVNDHVAGERKKTRDNR